MSIIEFHAMFVSKKKGARLIEMLRRVSRLRPQALLAVVPSGWPEWPRISQEPVRTPTA
jgi:hypothetical protein